MGERTPVFGGELRRWRTAASMSLPELARRVHYSTGHLSKIENGHKRPTADLARLCDGVLETHGELAALVRAQEAGAPPDREPQSPVESWTLSLSGDGGGTFLPLDHRTATGAGHLEAFGLRFSPHGAAVAARDETSPLAFRALFDQLRAFGQMYSPSVVLPALIPVTGTLRAMAAGAEGAVRIQLVTLAARYAEYTGWMAQEAGNEPAALWWTDEAVRISLEIGDTDLARFALMRKADVALYREDARNTVGLSREAQADTSVSARVRGLAAQREAQGHALAGDDLSCFSALDQARVLLELARSEATTAPILGTQNVPDPVMVATGWCLHDLGRPAEAAEVLEAQVAALPSTARRVRGLYGARLALAYASAGEIDEACRQARGILEDVTAVDSASSRAVLKNLGRILARWRTHAPARELRADLMSLAES